ncbi:MAG: GGDEF domain-containing protein [Candidatus Omnitrophica bacterium]|nr:GGDEF domain-containing protein [Candidatus Omnitrophota bacterium]
MDHPPLTPSLTLRWLVVIALLVAGATLATLLTAASPPSVNAIQTVCLLLVAVAVYAWLLYPTAGSAVIGIAVMVALAWAWASRHTPVLQEAEALGVLAVVAAWQRRRRWRRRHHLQQVLDDLSEEQTVKDQAIAAAVQTREALQKKLSRYTQLQVIAEELSNMTELRAIARLAVERAFALIGKSDVCLVFLVDQERQALSLFASKRRESIASIRAKHGDQFDRYVLRTHRPLLVNDVRRDFRFTVTIAPERDVSSVIACPLLLGQRPEGVLRLDSAKPGAYTQDDLRLLDILLDLVSTAAMNAKLFAQTQQLAVTDGLTGLTLRRPFLEQLTRELTRAHRSREAVSLLMLDVDRFKQYNDAFGHTAGDLILKGVAEMLRSALPAGGLIARYGGEEFVVLLPRMARPQASELAEQIRRRVEQHLQGRGRGAPASATTDRVTVSVGVASFPDDAQAELELIRMADQRLYQAKRSGRNLVVAS